MSLFLTKVEIDHQTAHLTGLRDAYDWHQKIWHAFPGRDGEPRDFLTRLDAVDDHLRLLLLSKAEPTRPDWCPESAWKSKTISEDFLGHASYGFSLVANATKKIRNESKNGRRIPLTKREDLVAWIGRKGESGGFSIEPSSLRTIGRPRQQFIKRGKAGRHDATEFRGILTVTDREKFAAIFEKGIGTAKAFGFGMLVISPI